ncbi:hypothetical protein [Rhodococcus sp. BS-15]|uniref:hypothetical protein n=1 Tax=Rhodococcus sp. BS-15 TaxID=1304954 RepID=UPI000A4244F5|nr:hypothetical protein [Rhodococcus sp. BS-15]
MSGTPNNADRKHRRLRVPTTNSVDAKNALIELNIYAANAFGSSAIASRPGCGR